LVIYVAGVADKARERIKVSGMRCAGCAARIEDALREMEGVIDAKVNFASSIAVVEYDPSAVSVKEIDDRIRSLGYDVVLEKLELMVGELHCVSCALGLERSLLMFRGIREVRVDPVGGRVRVVYNPLEVSPREIKRIIMDLGYEVREGEVLGEERPEEKELSLYRKLLFLSIMLTIPVTFFTYFWVDLPLLSREFLLFLLATPVEVVCGFPFFYGMVRGIRHGQLTMDTLVAVGTGAAYVYSTAKTFIPVLPGEVFFDAAVLLITFILMGRFLEAKARGKTSEAIRRLAELQVKTARVLRDGREVEVPIEEVKRGDLVIVRPGERVPLDGVVVEGESWVDESMITGEPMPVGKKPGDEVIGGTINRYGVLKVKVTRVGDETVLAQIMRVVEGAMTTKPRVQKIADRFAAYFVQIIIAVATFASLFWLFIVDPAQFGWTGARILFALMVGISTLVIACPCALGLATPTAVMVGLGKGAESGILIRKGEALEVAGKLTTVVFDKTGTLTIGRPEVVDFVLLDGVDISEEEVLRIAAVVEKNSNHPIGDAIVRFAESKGVMAEGDAEEFEVLPGLGVIAKLSGNRVVIGNRRIFEKEEINLDGVKGKLESLEKRARTTVVMAVNGRPVAIFGIADKIKEPAVEAINALRKMGIRVVMLTGDDRKTAEAIAKELGIEEVIAEVLPQEKSMKIRELQERGEVVAMVGDGINDAPALVQADLGIAIGSGTDIAIESGDIILIRDDLRDVINAIELSRATMRKIKQNLAWAVCYNLFFVPFAAGLFFPILHFLIRPEFAGLAMSMSSVSVVSNSLTLRRWRPPLSPSNRS